jgi:O-antigen/teichoic acid export membrane protein
VRAGLILTEPRSESMTAGSPPGDVGGGAVRDSAPGAVRSGAVLLAAASVSTAASYLFTVLSGNVLGPADYGVLAALLAVVTIVSLPMGAIQLGLSGAVAQHLEENRPNDAAAMSRGVFLLSLKTALVIGAVFLAVSAPLAQLLQLDSAWPVVFLCPVAGIGIVYAAFLGDIQGRQRFTSLAWATALPAVMRLILFIGLALLGLRLFGALAATVVPGIAVLGLCALWCRETLSSRQARSLSELAPWLRDLLPIAVTVGAVTALTQIDLLVVKGALSPHDAGIYAAASTLARLALFVPIALSSVVFPRVAARVVRGEDTQDILGRTIIAILAFCAVLFGGLTLFGDPIVRFAFGSDFAGAVELLPLFALGTTSFSLAYILASYHLACSRPRFAWVLAGGALVDAAVLGVFHGSLTQVLWVNAGVGVGLLVVHELVIGSTRGALAQGARHLLEETRERRVISVLRERSRVFLRRVRFPALLTVAYTGITALITWPVATRFGSSFYGIPNDNLGGIWFYWWWNHARELGVDPAHSPLLSAPFGIDVGSIPVQPVEKWVATLLTGPLGEVATYNLIVLSSFPLAGLAMYLFANGLLKNRMAAAIAGGIYTFSPFHLGMALNYTALAATYWVPLYALCLYRALTVRSWKWIAATVLCYGVLLISSYYYGFFAAAVTGVVLVVAAVRGRRLIASAVTGLKAKRLSRGRLATVVVGSVGGAGIMSLILARPISLYLDDRAGFTRPLSEAVRYSARPWAWFIPGRDHPVMGDRLSTFYDRHLNESPVYEQALYLGYGALALAVCGYFLVRKRRELRRVFGYAGLLAVSGALIALGPFIPLSSTYYSNWAGFEDEAKIPFVGRLLYEIAPTFRFFSRAQVFVVLGLALAAGVGAVWLLTRRRRLVGTGVLVLLCGLVAFEYTNRPPARVFEIPKAPEVYRWLKDRPGQPIVAEYPMSGGATPRSLFYMFWERYHAKPIVNYPATPEAGAFFNQVQDIVNPSASATLAGAGVKYVIVHTRLAPATSPPYQPALPNDALPRGLVDDYPHLKRVARFPSADVYELRKEPQPTSRPGVLGFGAGFFPEEGPPARRSRWMGTSGDLVVFPFAAAGTRVWVDASVNSFHVSRALVARIDGDVVARVRVSATSPTRFRVPVTLSDVPVVVSVAASPAAESPDAVLGTGDLRQLSVSWSGVRLRARP